MDIADGGNFVTMIQRGPAIQGSPILLLEIEIVFYKKKDLPV